METGIIITLSNLWIRSSSTSRSYSIPSLGHFPHMHAVISTLLRMQGRDLQQIPGIFWQFNFSLEICPMNLSCLVSSNFLTLSPEPELRDSDRSTWILSPCSIAWKLTPENNLGNCRTHLWFLISQRSEILVSNIWCHKNHYFTNSLCFQLFLFQMWG